MRRRALLPEQRLDALGNVDEAMAAVRSAMEVEPTAGPLIVAAFRALTALGELRETIDGMPIAEGPA